MFDRRQREADTFYDTINPAHLGEAERKVQRQALAGMIWSKQFFIAEVIIAFILMLSVPAASDTLAVLVTDDCHDGVEGVLHEFLVRD